MRREDLTGMRFGRLVAVEYRRLPNGSGKLSYSGWVCKCDCGGEAHIRTDLLKEGITASCGCLASESVAERNRKHGATERGKLWPEYAVWRSMLARCFNPKNHNYSLYGGRGITVCDRWRFGEGSKSSFGCFIEDVGRRPSDDLSIDRYPDNDGNYEPKNCRWATMKEQSNNRRPRKACKAIVEAGAP